jgi:uncharacterized membrane protein
MDMIFPLIALIFIGLFLPTALLIWLLVRQGRLMDAVDDVSYDLRDLRRRVVALVGSDRKEQAERQPAPEVPPKPAPSVAADTGAAPVPRRAVQASVAAASEDTAPGQRQKTPPPIPVAEPVKPAAVQPPDLEARSRRILQRMWNWLLYGAEELPEGVSKEYAMATHLLLLAGIAIVVLGMGFFLKYSFEHGLIGPYGRTALSILTGIGMVGAGLRLARSDRYRMLGLGITGGGLAVLYWAVYALTMYYHILHHAWALPLVIAVTIAAGVIAVRLDSALLALIGILGAYGSPIMLVMEKADYAGVFTYLLILSVGVLAISIYRRWYLFNYLGFLFTYGLFIAVLEKYYKTADFHRVFWFLVLFFILYAAVSYIHNVLKRRQATLVELGGQVANAGLFFVLGYGLIADVASREWVALLTVGAAAFYTLHALVFLRARIRDRGLLLCLLALAAFFITITMPILISGEWLTAAWAIQALLMLWLSCKLQSRFVRNLAYLMYIITLARLSFIDFGREFGYGAGSQTWRGYLSDCVSRLVAFGVPILSFFGAWKLNKAQVRAFGISVEQENDVSLLPNRGLQQVVFWAAAFLLFIYANLEFNRLFGAVYKPLQEPMLTLVWVGMCGFLLLRYCMFRKVGTGILLGLFAAGLLVKLMAADMSVWQGDLGMLAYRKFLWHMSAVRLLDFGLIIGFCVWAWRTLSVAAEKGESIGGRIFGVLALALLFLFLSMEVNTFLRDFAPGFRAGGVSILWTLFALSFLFSGIRRNVRAMRYAGLVLFAVVVVKVFSFDLGKLDPLYRIIAFIALGVLVLSGSFLYLRFRDKFEELVPATGEKDAADR